MLMLIYLFLNINFNGILSISYYYIYDCSIKDYDACYFYAFTESYFFSSNMDINCGLINSFSLILFSLFTALYLFRTLYIILFWVAYASATNFHNLLILLNINKFLTNIIK